MRISEDDGNLAEYKTQKNFFKLIEYLNNCTLYDNEQFKKRYESVYVRVYSKLKELIECSKENDGFIPQEHIESEIEQYKKWLKMFSEEVGINGKNNPKKE